MSKLVKAVTQKHITEDTIDFQFCSDWLKDEIKLLFKEIDSLKKELKTHKNLLKDICDEWNEECDTDCSSYGHTTSCKATDIANAKRALKEQKDTLNIVLKEAIEIIEDNAGPGFSQWIDKAIKLTK